MVSLCINTGAYAQSYNASYADKHEIKHGVYHSKLVNKKVKGLDSKEEAKVPDLTGYYNASNFDYKCPGYSFIVGIKSTFKIFDESGNPQKHSADRDFSFVCAFLEDKEDRLIHKIKCETPKSSDNPNEKNGQSRCSDKGQFIHGLRSQRYRQASADNELVAKFFKDRVNTSSCCELQDYERNNFTATSCEVKEFPANKDFSFTCPSGKILKQIKTTYHDHKDGYWGDRSYEFTCCKVTAGE